jgi:hypothetical protein
MRWRIDPESGRQERWLEYGANEARWMVASLEAPGVVWVMSVEVV